MDEIRYFFIYIKEILWNVFDKSYLLNCRIFQRNIFIKILFSILTF